MSKDKYRSIFSPQMEAIVFNILQIFFVTRGIFSDIPQFWLGNIRSRDVFRPIARKREYLRETVNFVSRESQCFSRRSRGKKTEIRGKRNSLFPKGPVNKWFVI